MEDRQGMAAPSNPLRTESLTSITQLLEETYVFPDKAAKAIAAVQERWRRGDYDALISETEFAAAVTTDLQRVTGDAHLRLVYDPARVAKLMDAKARGMGYSAVELAKRCNHGFARVENLKGNVGYVDIRHFFTPEIAGDAAAAAMRLVSDADAVIVDLRNNTGGNPSMVQLLCSFFFDGETPIHLNTILSRPKRKSTEYWVLPEVPGERMPDTPLYVLTSPHTFSGGEEFAYNMAALHRGTIVGESTAGGANPAGMIVVSEAFYATIPHASPVNPVTGSNWEGCGVTPHVEVLADRALEAAHILAVRQRIENETEELARAKLEWALEEIASTYRPVMASVSTLERYVGSYGETEILLEDGGLIFKRRFFRYRLVPLGETHFWLDGPAAGFESRVNFVQDEQGVVAGLIAAFPDGRRITRPRT